MQKVTPLRSAQPIVHINTFGAFLKYLRERVQIPQKELVETFPLFFEEYRVSALTPDMYRKLEKGNRAPQFEELLPLYAALIGNQFKISPQERSSYVRLARLKQEGLQRKRPKLRPDGEWRLLEIQLAQLEKNGRSSRETGNEITSVEGQGPRKSTLDTSHIVGRDQWLIQMLSYLGAPQKKLVVIQGMMGIGKTSGLKLLLHSMLKQEECYPVLYTFSSNTNATPTDHLDTFLATILAELQVSEPEVSKTPSLTKRIEQVIKQLAERQERVVLLVDDAQVILDGQGQLPQEWQQFFASYLSANHQALIYLATREWPFWTGRNRSFIVDGDAAVLPALDQQAGVDIWQRLGFTDVPENLLQQATTRCGGNALMIELRAANLQRPRFSFGWRRNTLPEEKKSEHQQLIEQLLTDTHIFGSADVEARQLLQQVIGQRLSHDALQILEALAASPLALPFPLLLEINPQAEYAFAELLQASLIDRDAMEQNERAALLPLAREAAIHQLMADKHLAETEKQFIPAYTIWLEQGTFISEQEQALLITELGIAHLKQHQFLDAAELIIEYGWLSFAFGYAPRLARITDETMRSFNWHRLQTDEAGGLLLQYYLLARTLDQDLSGAATAEHKKAYLHLYELMNTESAALRPQTIAHLVHHKLRYLIRAKQYAEAQTLIDEACTRYEDFQNSKPATYIELLDRRAYVLGRWGDRQDALAKKETDETLAKRERDEAFRLRQEAVTVHEQCVALLLQHERFASPIQQSHIRFKRARLLNDLAYYRRCTGQLEEAKLAMEECIMLKEAGFVIPSSLAVSYDDYGQLLGQLGHFQEALAYSDRALQIIQKLIDEGESSAFKEKGMLLINRGKLLLLLGKLNEAKALFAEGTHLVEGTSRDASAFIAAEGLKLIEVWQKTNPRCQLDWRWYPRYRQLASYSDIKWLTQAGPFSEEEQYEWNNLIDQREDPNTAKRLSAIIVQSRKRELTACREEQREPHFHYPLIPCTEIQSRLEGFSQLRTEIGHCESNTVVRRLYLAAIDERLDELNLVAATGRQDDNAFWLYNQHLNSIPNMFEIEQAIRQLTGTLRRGLQRDDTRDLSKHIIAQTAHWLINPASLESLDIMPEQETEIVQSSIDKTQKLFSPETVGRFFEYVFRAYQFSWSVAYDLTTDHARVNLSKRQVTVPGEKWISVEKIRELLGHEIETHVFRSSAGEKSPLELLSAGLQGFLEAEEGLAVYYAQEIDPRGSNSKPNKSWIGTLATGLASGLVCEPFTFRSLLSFLEPVEMLRGLLAGKTHAEVQEEAPRIAENRCLRTWRGVTDLSHPGICSTKDNVYLRGYLSIVQAMKEDKTVFERLMVGSVGLHHLADLAELGITQPTIIHQRLATDPRLENYILQFADVDLP